MRGKLTLLCLVISIFVLIMPFAQAQTPAALGSGYHSPSHVGTLYDYDGDNVVTSYQDQFLLGVNDGNAFILEAIDSDLNFIHTGTTAVTIDGDNTRLGIGIPAPLYTLHTTGNDAAIAIYSQGAISSQGAIYAGNGAAALTSTLGSGLDVTGGTTTDDLTVDESDIIAMGVEFNAADSATEGTVQWVGGGTDQLQVHDGTNWRPLLSSTTGGSSQLWIEEPGDGDIFYSAGNVGIGATPGAYNLDVTGTAHVSTTMEIDGAATLSDTLQVTNNVDITTGNLDVQTGTFHAAGLAGIGAPVGSDALTVGGGITLGTSAQTNDGTIRWVTASGQLQVYDAGVGWRPLVTTTDTATSTEIWVRENDHDIYYTTGNVGIGASPGAYQLEVTGTTHLTSTLNADGAATFGSTLTATGHGEFDSTLNADGAATFGSTLTATGHGEFDSTLNADGVVTFGNTLAVTGNTGIGAAVGTETLTLGGAVTIGDRGAGAAPDGTLKWTGSQLQVYDVGVGWRPLVTTTDTATSTEIWVREADNDVYYTSGSVGIGATPDNSYDLDVDEDALIGTNLDVGGNVDVTGTLGVTGTSTLGVLNAGASTLNSLDVTTNADVTGTLGVTGHTSLSTLGTSGLATLNSLDVTTNADVTGTLGVTGHTSLSTLGTSGLATLNSLDVTNNAVVGGTLGVTGATTLSDTLTVDGAATFNDAISVSGRTTTADLTVDNSDILAMGVEFGAADTATEGTVQWVGGTTDQLQVHDGTEWKPIVVTSNGAASTLIWQQNGAGEIFTDASDRVGIGTNNPNDGANLHVVGTGIIETASGRTLTFGDISGGQGITASNDLYVVSPQNIHFGTGSGSGVILRVDGGTGFVGVGTGNTVASHQLDVNGDADFDSKVYVGTGDATDGVDVDGTLDVGGASSLSGGLTVSGGDTFINVGGSEHISVTSGVIGLKSSGTNQLTVNNQGAYVWNKMTIGSGTIDSVELDVNGDADISGNLDVHGTFTVHI